MDLHTTDSELELNAEMAQATMKHQNNEATTPTRQDISSAISPTSQIVASSSEENHGHGGRPPTFKQYGDIIKRLEHENFQLKLRIYMHDSKYGKSVASGGGAQESISATAVELAREFTALKDSRDNLSKKVRELELQHKDKDECLQAASQREEILQRRIEELTSKLDILDHELALANLRKTEDFPLDKSLMAFNIEAVDESPCLLPANGASAQETEELLQKVSEVEEANRELKEKLDIACEDLATKTGLIGSLESLLKDKNERLTQLEKEAATSKEKIVQMTVALKGLGFRNADEEAQHSSLKLRFRELLEDHEKTCAAFDNLKREYNELVMNRDHHQDRPEDSSPDLGIESGGHENHAAGSETCHKDPTTVALLEDKIRELKLLNKELANKLRQTKMALDKTLERLNKTEMNKEQVEKAVCRQLHRTHGILRAARKNLENPPAEPTIPLTEIN